MAFGESNGWCITCITLYMNHLSPLSLFLFVFVSGRRLRSDRSVQMLPSPHFLPLASLCLRPCHYLIYTPPFIAIPRSKGRKKALFSCRGCNFMLSKPIVLQKLHLLFSSIVYWAYGSGRRLDRHNYAASQTRETSFFLHMNQCFLEAKGEDRLDEYIYPLRKS